MPRAKVKAVDINSAQEEVKEAVKEDVKEDEKEEEKEPIKEEVKTRVNSLHPCPKCNNFFTKKTLRYYHDCTKKTPRPVKEYKVVRVEKEEEKVEMEKPKKEPKKKVEKVEVEEDEHQIRTRRLSKQRAMRQEHLGNLFLSAI